MTPTQLRKAIKASGLTIDRFARDVVLREVRTVYRWLSGDSPVPRVVADYLEGET